MSQKHRKIKKKKAYLVRILLTQPWETLSRLEMSQGRVPVWASSTMSRLISSGSGRPLTNEPPS
jgi:hypothetical protein